MDLPVKNRELSKFFLCFKPVTSDEGAVRPAMSDDESGRKKKKVHRSFSRAVKAVFFETSLMKKIQRKKSRKNSFRSNSDPSSKNEKSVKKSVSYKDLSNYKEIFRTNSNHSSSLFSSNPSSSRSTSISSNSFASSINSSHSRSLSEIKRSTSFDYNNLKGFNESYAGICIFLVSLFSLVIWGKFFAILTCTSSCLFFGPRPRIESPVKDIYTDVQKKRVIMEGMLERNRSKVLLP